MKKLILWILVLVAGFQIGLAQEVTIKGKAVDSDTKSALISATVVLLNSAREVKYHDITNTKGEFSLAMVKKGTYTLRITYIGYDSLEQELNISARKDVNLGDVPVKVSSVNTPEIEVTAKAPVGEQREDTTIINASRFKTQPDATAEDLVKKMPGIQIDQTGVKAHGEDVKKVLVDGKPFFGDDPSVALKNLPAELIDKVQIYDKMSDQSEFSGFDDGNSSKTLNILTKRTKMNGQFGKGSVGYGTDSKYIGSLNANYFNGPQRISLLGLTNNINQQNFAFMDILDMFGGGGRQGQQFRQAGARMFGGMQMTQQRGDQKMFGGGGGGMGAGMSDFFSGPLDGVSTTHAVGLNYNDAWAENIDFSGSYFINYTDNNNNQFSNRDYLIQSDSLPNFLQTSKTNQVNQNHRMNFKFNWQIDTSNSVIIQPYLTVQKSKVGNDLNSNNMLSNNTPVNTTKSDYGSNYSGLNFSNDLLLRHRFIPGRTASLSITTSYNDKTGSSDLLNSNSFMRKDSTINSSLNQQSDVPTGGYGLSANAVYTEPLHEGGQLQLNYTLGYNSNYTDKRTYNFDNISSSYDLLDSVLSNSFDNNYLTNKAGAGYRYKNDKMNLTAMVVYQNAELKSAQVYPKDYNITTSFSNVLPSLRFNYKFSKQSNLFLNYRTNTNMPSIQQLQNVLDNSNPTQLSIGNPDLKQQYTNSIMARFANFSEDFTNIFHGFVNFSYRTDYIGTSTTFNNSLTPVTLADKVILPPGAQLSKPVNLDGFWNATAFLTYGFPLIFMSSNINLNAGGIYTRTPSLVNGESNSSNMFNMNFILVLSSNISENLDFTISSRASLVSTKNTLQSSLDNKYNSYTTAVNLKWIFWSGFFLEADFRNQAYSGLVQNNSAYNLLNFGIGKKFLENNAAEIKLSVFDALKQNKSYNTSVTDYYVEYSQNQVLQQYVMLTFSYNLRKFKMFGPMF